MAQANIDKWGHENRDYTYRGRNTADSYQTCPSKKAIAQGRDRNISGETEEWKFLHGDRPQEFGVRNALEQAYAEDIAREAHRWRQELERAGHVVKLLPPFGKLDAWTVDSPDAAGPKERGFPHCDMHYKLATPPTRAAIREHVRRRKTTGAFPLVRGEECLLTIHIEDESSPTIFVILT